MIKIKMKTLHIILKNTVDDGSYEQIEIDKVGDVKINEGYLMIYSDEIMPVHPPMGKFFLTEIVGYWIEEV